MIPENGNCTLDTILEGILTEGEDVEEAVRTMRSDLLRAAMPTMPTLRSTMPIITMPANLNVKAEQPDSCSESMVSPKNVLLYTLINYTGFCAKMLYFLDKMCLRVWHNCFLLADSVTVR